MSTSGWLPPLVRGSGSGRHTPQVAVEAIRGRKDAESVGVTVQGASERLSELFVDGRTRQTNPWQPETDALFEQIGCRKVALEWIKKNTKWS